jgi:hypothetical protein
VISSLVLAAALLAAPPPTAGAEAPATTLNAAGLGRYQSASLQIQSGDNAGALLSLNALAAEFPFVAEVFAARCSAFLGIGSPLAAAGECGRALGLKPGYSPALYGLASAHDALGRPADAAEYYRRYAQSQDPNALPDFKARAAARAEQLVPTAVAVSPSPYPPAPAAFPAAPASPKPLGPECLNAKGVKVCYQFTMPVQAEDPFQVLTRALAINGLSVVQANPQAGTLVTAWQNTNFGYGFIGAGRGLGATIWRRYLVIVARAQRTAAVTVRLENRRCVEGAESPDGVSVRYGECVEFPDGPVKKHQQQFEDLGDKLKSSVGGS